MDPLNVFFGQSFLWVLLFAYNLDLPSGPSSVVTEYEVGVMLVGAETSQEPVVVQFIVRSGLALLHLRCVLQILGRQSILVRIFGLTILEDAVLGGGLIFSEKVKLVQL